MPPTRSSGKSRSTAPMDFPECKVYRPTMEEFSNLRGMIDKMEAEDCHIGGIAKIIVPEEYKPRQAGYDAETFPFIIEKPLKQHFTSISNRGTYQTSCMSQRSMTIKEYEAMAKSSDYRAPPHNDYDDLARKYWKSLNFMDPIYGADVSNSITDPEVNTFNVAKLDSILNLVVGESGEVYAGVNSPYLYFGMWKATFSWHVEDMDLYALNFIHHGEPKTWYCVPPKYGYILEQAARKVFPNVAQWCSNFMRHKTCLIQPSILDDLGVPYQKVVQREREIIVVFPYAYHSGFNHGYNIAESTNFAFERWVEYGKRHRPCDCTAKGVKFDMGIFIKKYQPENFDKWKAGQDIGPHPEDPDDVRDEILMRAKDPKAYAKMLEEEKKEKDIAVVSYSTKSGRSITFNTNTMTVTRGTLSDEDKPDFEIWKRINFFNKEGEQSVTMLDTYQHVDLPMIKTTVYRDDLTYFGGHTVHALRKMLGRDIADIKELIAKGDMIKISSKPRVMDINNDDKDNDNTISKTVEMNIEAAVYRHADQNDLTVNLDRKTLVLVGPQSEEFNAFALDGKSMADLIDIGVFEKVKDCVVTVRKEIKVEAEKKKVKVPLKQIRLYRHKDSGIELWVSGKSKRIFPFQLKSDNDEVKVKKVEQLLGGKTSLDELIKYGACELLEKVNLEPEKIFIYTHLPTKTLFEVNNKTFDLVNEEVTSQMNDLIGSKTLKEFINAKDVIRIGEKMANNEGEKDNPVIINEDVPKGLDLNVEYDEEEILAEKVDNNEVEAANEDKSNNKDEKMDIDNLRGLFKERRTVDDFRLVVFGY